MPKPLHVKHIAYAGLGGHANMFFVMQDASKNTVNHSVVFYGVEPIEPAYKSKCDSESIEYDYVHKAKKLDFKYYYQIYKAVAKKEVDIIFLHNSGLILPAFFARIFHGKKIIVRETHANHLKTKADWVFLILAFWLANKTVLLSQAYFSELKEKVGRYIKPKKVVIIPNGLDLDKFKSNISLKDNSTITIGMQSRLVPIKDHLSLVKALDIVLKKFPTKNIKLVIAGDGSTRLEIEKLVDSLGLNNAVEMTGMLNEYQLLEMLQKLDIYVHSTLGETMSNAIMQAQAVGLPVIATNVKGVNNVITHEANGFLFELYDFETLAQQLTYLIENESELNKYGQLSRQYAETHLSSKKMIADYITLFKNQTCT